MNSHSSSNRYYADTSYFSSQDYNRSGYDAQGSDVHSATYGNVFAGGSDASRTGSYHGQSRQEQTLANDAVAAALQAVPLPSQEQVHDYLVQHVQQPKGLYMGWTIEGVRFDVYELFSSVIRAGGSSEVTRRDLWPVVATLLNLPARPGSSGLRSTPEMGNLLRKFFLELLGGLEILWDQTKLAADNRSSSSVNANDGPRKATSHSNNFGTSAQSSGSTPRIPPTTSSLRDERTQATQQSSSGCQQHNGSSRNAPSYQYSQQQSSSAQATSASSTPQTGPQMRMPNTVSPAALYLPPPQPRPSSKLKEQTNVTSSTGASAKPSSSVSAPAPASATKSPAKSKKSAGDKPPKERKKKLKNTDNQAPPAGGPDPPSVPDPPPAQSAPPPPQSIQAASPPPPSRTLEFAELPLIANYNELVNSNILPLPIPGPGMVCDLSGTVAAQYAARCQELRLAVKRPRDDVFSARQLSSSEVAFWNKLVALLKQNPGIVIPGPDHFKKLEEEAAAAALRSMRPSTVNLADLRLSRPTVPPPAPPPAPAPLEYSLAPAIQIDSEPEALDPPVPSSSAFDVPTGRKSKKSGRPRFPRDENGNIVYPEGYENGKRREKDNPDHELPRDEEGNVIHPEEARSSKNSRKRKLVLDENGVPLDPQPPKKRGRKPRIHFDENGVPLDPQPAPPVKKVSQLVLDENGIPLDPQPPKKRGRPKKSVGLAESSDATIGSFSSPVVVQARPADPVAGPSSQPVAGIPLSLHALIPRPAGQVPHSAAQASRPAPAPSQAARSAPAAVGAVVPPLPALPALAPGPAMPAELAAVMAAAKAATDALNAVMARMSQQPQPPAPRPALPRVTAPPIISTEMAQHMSSFPAASREGPTPFDDVVPAQLKPYIPTVPLALASATPRKVLHLSSGNHAQAKIRGAELAKPSRVPKKAQSVVPDPQPEADAEGEVDEWEDDDPSFNVIMAVDLDIEAEEKEELELEEPVQTAAKGKGKGKAKAVAPPAKPPAKPVTTAKQPLAKKTASIPAKASDAGRVATRNHPAPAAPLPKGGKSLMSKRPISVPSSQRRSAFLREPSPPTVTRPSTRALAHEKPGPRTTRHGSKPGAKLFELPDLPIRKSRAPVAPTEPLRQMGRRSGGPLSAPASAPVARMSGAKPASASMPAASRSAPRSKRFPSIQLVEDPRSRKRARILTPEPAAPSVKKAKTAPSARGVTGSARGSIASRLAVRKPALARKAQPLRARTAALRYVTSARKPIIRKPIALPKPRTAPVRTSPSVTLPSAVPAEVTEVLSGSEYEAEADVDSEEDTPEPAEPPTLERRGIPWVEIIVRRKRVVEMPIDRAIVVLPISRRKRKTLIERGHYDPFRDDESDDDTFEERTSYAGLRPIKIAVPRSKKKLLIRPEEPESLPARFLVRAGPSVLEPWKSILDESTLAKRAVVSECGWKGCESMLGSEALLLHHVMKRKHAQQGKFKAGTYCGRTLFRCKWYGCEGPCFESESALVQHMTARHISKVLACPYTGCDLTSPNVSHLTRHVTRHHDANASVRPIADLSTPTPSPPPAHTLPEIARADELTTPAVQPSVYGTTARNEWVRSKVQDRCFGGENPIMHTQHPPHMLQHLEDPDEEVVPPDMVPHASEEGEEDQANEVVEGEEESGGGVEGEEVDEADIEAALAVLDSAAITDVGDEVAEEVLVDESDEERGEDADVDMDEEDVLNSGLAAALLAAATEEDGEGGEVEADDADQTEDSGLLPQTDDDNDIDAGAEDGDQDSEEDEDVAQVGEADTDQLSAAMQEDEELAEALRQEVLAAAAAQINVIETEVDVETPAGQAAGNLASVVDQAKDDDDASMDLDDDLETSIEVAAKVEQPSEEPGEGKTLVDAEAQSTVHMPKGAAAAEVIG